jgi:energy-coupling factor transporter ATP-binding protein EcfA2
MIATTALELRAGARLLVSGVTVRINSGDRIGFVGRNGAGKSTLAKVLAGETLPAGGGVQRTGKIGYLPQDPRTGEDQGTALDRILSARDLDQIAIRMSQVEHEMSTTEGAELEKALGSKVQYIDLNVNPQIGFRGIMVNGPRGPIKCIPDQNCPSGSVFGLQLSTFKLYSLGKAVRVIDSDGLQMLRQASADGVEVRYGFYGNLGCRAPGYNINISV